MAGKSPYARIAITLPPETLRAADELAARHDRSRSWIVAEAIRQYAAALGADGLGEDASTRLGASRMEQLRRDAALTPEERVLASEEIAAIGGVSGEPVTPLAFESFDDFLAWRHAREGR